MPDLKQYLIAKRISKNEETFNLTEKLYPKTGYQKPINEIQLTPNKLIETKEGHRKKVRIYQKHNWTYTQHPI